MFLDERQPVTNPKVFFRECSEILFWIFLDIHPEIQFQFWTLCKIYQTSDLKKNIALGRDVQKLSLVFTPPSPDGEPGYAHVINMLIIMGHYT